MVKRFKIVKVDYKYCDYLRKFDNRISYNAGMKELRPFIGILFSIDDFEYFAPLSSPKPKHMNLTNTVDLIKIANGRYGVINFNNMLPVTKINYELLDLNGTPISNEDFNRKNLLKSQLKWLK